MTPPPTQPQPDPLDTTTLAVIVRATMDAVPRDPDISADEQAARCHTAFSIIATLRPRDPLEAMLAARIAAAHFHIMDNFRCAADHDLSPNMKLRYRASAVALTRMQEAAQRELMRRQTFPAVQPAALPVAVPAPRAQPAPANAPGAPASQATHASRQAAEAAGQLPGSVAAPRRATGGFVAPTDAEIEGLVTEVEARLDAASALLAA
jgi:hypothetical protein